MARTYAIASENQTVLDLAQGDICTQETDAIANAANASLLGGGGVDGAIHRAAGDELLEACRAIKRTLPNGMLRTGGAVMTPGFNLAAKYVVHCVGPIYAREGGDAPALLTSCYREALSLVRAQRLSSIALPSISTGAYGYPVRQAARIAISTVVDELMRHGQPTLVRFVLFDDDTLAKYEEAAEALLGAKR